MGISTQTIKKCISKLEETYFPNKNIFRNGDKKSDYLFRYEIKGLLLLLIELECNDVFRDGKAKKDGISKNSIEKIVKTYDKAYTSNILSDYEQRILMTTFNGRDSLQFIKTMNAFQESLTNFSLLIVKYYNKMSSDFFNDVVKELDEWSLRIVRHFELSDELHSQVNQSIDYHLDPKTMFTHIEDIGNLQLDLKNAVVRTINILANELYSFDEEGKCSRKSLPEQIKRLYVGPESDEYTTHAKELFEQYSFSEDGGKTYMSYRFDEDDSYYLKSIRLTLDAFLERFFRNLIPNESIFGNPIHQKGNTTRNRDRLEDLTKLYLQAYLCARFVTYDIFEPTCSEMLFDNYDVLREQLYGIRLNGEIYKDHLRKLERKIWKYMCSDNNNNKMYIELLNPEKWAPDINKMLSETLDEFYRCAERNKVAFDRESHENLKQLFVETKYSYINENAEELYETCKTMISNMLAMILKIESKRTADSE